jgi:Fe-Mn family superoxide dismutase
MSIKLSKLPFSIDSLEPFISSETIYFHFEKHHAGYVNTLNKLIEGSAYDRLGLSEIMLISAKIPGDKKIFKNAAQVWNHDFYWKCLKNPAPACPKTVVQYLNECFGSENSFIESFVKAGTEHFGSGYVWLIKNEIGLLEIITTSNGETATTRTIERDAFHEIALEKIDALIVCCERRRASVCRQGGVR